jgi:hypothetical protein
MGNPFPEWGQQRRFQRRRPRIHALRYIPFNPDIALNPDKSTVAGEFSQLSRLLDAAYKIHCLGISLHDDFLIDLSQISICFLTFSGKIPNEIDYSQYCLNLLLTTN